MKPKRIIRAGLVAAVASTLCFASGTFAANDTVAGNIVGQGTISPGLPTTGSSPESFAFTGTGPFVDASNPSLSGAYTCFASGSSTGSETLASGQGTFSATCSETGIGSTSFSASGSYVRTGMVVTISGSVSGGITGVFGGGCTFHASSVNPVSSFFLYCAIHIP